ISLMHGALLSPQSIQAMTTNVPLNDRRPSGYGFGQFISVGNGKRVWRHDGEVAGYLSLNVVLPDEDLAFVVLTNGDFADATNAVYRRLAFRFREQSPHVALVRDVLADFQAGRIDRSRFTENANGVYTDEVVRALGAGLAPQGPARLVRLDGAPAQRGGLT